MISITSEVTPDIDSIGGILFEKITRRAFINGNVIEFNEGAETARLYYREEEDENGPESVPKLALKAFCDDGYIEKIIINGELDMAPGPCESDKALSEITGKLFYGIYAGGESLIAWNVSPKKLELVFYGPVGGGDSDIAAMNDYLRALEKIKAKRPDAPIDIENNNATS